MNFEKLELLYEAGDLKRLHTVRTHELYTLARHVYGSMIIAVELCNELSVSKVNILEALLYHDAPEIYTGDVPAPVKRNSRILTEHLEQLEFEFYKKHEIKINDLGPGEWLIVKACDTLDLAFTCYHERIHGNSGKKLIEVFGNCMLYLKEQHELTPVKDICNTLSREWTYCTH